MTAEYLDLAPINRASGTVRIPGSTSICQSCAAAGCIGGRCDSSEESVDLDDTRVMVDALQALGVRVDSLESSRVIANSRLRRESAFAKGRILPRQCRRFAR